MHHTVTFIYYATVLLFFLILLFVYFVTINITCNTNRNNQIVCIRLTELRTNSY